MGLHPCKRGGFWVVQKTLGRPLLPGAPIESKRPFSLSFPFLGFPVLPRKKNLKINQGFFLPCRTPLKPWKNQGKRTNINSVAKLGGIVKGEAQKSPLFLAIFWGLFDFLRIAWFSRNSTRKPLNLIKIPRFLQAPLVNPLVFYNAPSMHTVENKQGNSLLKINQGIKKKPRKRKDRVAPSPNHFWTLSLFVHFPSIPNFCCDFVVFPPYRASRSPRGGNPRKMGKNYKIPPRSNPRKIGKKLPKKLQKMYFRSIFCNFFGNFFPYFRGLDPGRGIL